MTEHHTPGIQMHAQFKQDATIKTSITYNITSRQVILTFLFHFVAMGTVSKEMLDLRFRYFVYFFSDWVMRRSGYGLL